MTSDPVLAVRDLAKRFGGIAAVDGVGFDVAAGELVALIGPNGAGKSTCFNMLSGQIKPDAGTVRVAGTDVTGHPPPAIWRAGVGRTFQLARVFGSMTVAENVQTACLSHAGQGRRLWPRATGRFRERALALLRRVQLAEAANRDAEALAYGDVKRLELAMALANDPILLLMDEPTAGMAPAERAGLMDLVRDQTREQARAVLFTEHDMDVVFGHADRVLVMDRGARIAEGTPDAVQADARVQAVYLGTQAGTASGSAATPC
jgi:branched-chain amino acid transport system ATP-binding protein